MIVLKIYVCLVLLAILVVILLGLADKLRSFFGGLIALYYDSQTVRALQLNQFDLHRASREDVVRMVKTRTEEEKTLLLYKLYRYLVSVSVEPSSVRFFDPANLCNHKNVRVLATGFNELHVAIGESHVLLARVPFLVPSEMVDEARLVSRGERFVETRKLWLEEESKRRRQIACRSLT